MQITEKWFDLSPLGFSGWEHNEAFQVTTNSAGSDVVLCTEVRMIGSDFPVRIYGNRRGLFDGIKSHIEKVETLVARQQSAVAA